MPRIKSFPKYSLHKPTGQVRVDGKDHYLGEFGSPASEALYDQLKRDWHYRRDVSGSLCTVDDLAIKYMEHAETYYLKGGQQTSEVNNLRIALQPLVQLFGSMRVANIESSHIEKYVDCLIKNGIVRTSINRQLERIKRVFKWGKRHKDKLVTTATLCEVTVVPGLREGRSQAIESDPVTSVSDALPNVFSVRTESDRK